jgi:hypothetical protein
MHMFTLRQAVLWPDNVADGGTHIPAVLACVCVS